MHKLLRQVRFNIDPFAVEQTSGCNSLAGRPCGRGLAFYLALWVELAGRVDVNTGFVINVMDIDDIVTNTAVGLIADDIQTAWRNKKNITIEQLADMLRCVWHKLADNLPAGRLCSLALEMNPARKIKIDSEFAGMMYYSEKFEFAASHKLWNDRFDEQWNFEKFGKCANPAGHGHNYTLEVTISRHSGPFDIGRFEQVIDENFIDAVDHKNLNQDVEGFSDKIPTVENIAELAWNRLQGKFPNAQLHEVAIWETDKTCCRYKKDK